MSYPTPRTPKWPMLLKIAVAFAVSTLAVFPEAPIMPAVGLDPSWMHGMNTAVVKGIDIGRELIFTFGPLAHLYTDTFHPSLFGTYVLFNFVLILSISALAVLGGRMSWVIIATLSLFIFLDDPSGPVFHASDLLAFFAMFMPAFLMFSVFAYCPHPEKDLRIPLIALVATPVYAALPLEKLSFLAGVLVFAPLVVLGLMMARRPLMAVGFVLGVFGLNLGFWVAAGEPADNWPDYYLAALEIISGYGNAMSYPFYPASWVGPAIFLMACVLVAISVLVCCPGTLLVRVLILVAFAGFLFLAFKASFVRDDAFRIVNAVLALAIASVVSAHLARSGSFVSEARKRLGLVLSILTVGLAALLFTVTSLAADRLAFTATLGKFSNLWLGVGQNFNRTVLEARYDRAIEAMTFPFSPDEIEGTVDIYSFDQSPMLAQGFDWSPRPVFQSYAAYTSVLAKSNRDHLLSDEDAPGHIFFALQPIDGRLPTLMDGASWPTLFERYALQEIRDGYAHFARGPTEVVSTSPVSRRVVELGERVAIEDDGSVRFARVDLEPSLLGELLGTLFRNPPIYIDLEFEGGFQSSWRFIPGMAQEGFYISHVPVNLAEFARLASGQPNFMSRVSSFQMRTTPLGGFVWEDTYELTMEAHVIPRRPPAPGLPEPAEVVRLNDTPVPTTCLGVVDRVQNQPPQALDVGRVADDAPLRVVGWLRSAGPSSDVPENLSLRIVDEIGRMYRSPLTRTARPDVNLHLGEPEVGDLGFEAWLIVPAGMAIRELGILVETPEGVLSCGNLDIRGAGQVEQ